MSVTQIVKDGEAFLNGEVVRVEDVLRKAGVNAQAVLGKQVSWAVAHEKIVGLVVAVVIFAGGVLTGHLLK